MPQTKRSAASSWPSPVIRRSSSWTRSLGVLDTSFAEGGVARAAIRCVIAPAIGDSPEVPWSRRGRSEVSPLRPPGWRPRKPGATSGFPTRSAAGLRLRGERRKPRREPGRRGGQARCLPPVRPRSSRADRGAPRSRSLSPPGCRSDPAAFPAPSRASGVRACCSTAVADRRASPQAWTFEATWPTLPTLVGTTPARGGRAMARASPRRRCRHWRCGAPTAGSLARRRAPPPKTRPDMPGSHPLTTICENLLSPAA